MPKMLDHAEREIAVAEAAWRVLRDKGMRGMSVRNVATEAGLATGSLRRSFPTQASLMAYCVELVGERVAKRSAAMPPHPDPIEYAAQILEQVLPLDAERRIEMEVWLVMSTAALSDEELRRSCVPIDQSLEALASTVVQELRAAGHLPRDLDPEYETQRLYAILDGLAVHLLKRKPEEDTAWARDLLRRHLRELGTQDPQR